MEPRISWCIIFALLSLIPSSFGEISSNFSSESLDALLRDSAFKALDLRPRTGVLYRVPITSNLSGVEVYVTRLKSGSFWSRGENFSSIDIPRRVITMPYVKRLAIVYQNLANWSSSYYSIPGYSLVTPIVGFFTYNASNLSLGSISKLDLRVTGDPISIKFPSIELPKGSNSTIKCARFDAGGSVVLSDITLPNVCLTMNQGHFSMVIPSIPSLTPGSALTPVPSPAKLPNKGRKWKVWVIAFGGIVGGLVLVGLVGLVIFKHMKKKKMRAMEKQADEGEALGSIWVNGSRMPSATAIRTKPVLEDETVP
ncbi:uncharacterized protein LOC143891351 [Tasmannia lanceolata]|uniref:uncharacterized protein LOC143891351 n=1 Tax=Tasmannia lanceolata TaxID=3420 RepID=UPI004062EE6C